MKWGIWIGSFYNFFDCRKKGVLMSICGQEFKCLCGQPLSLTDEIRKRLEIGEDAMLRCEVCGCVAEIEHGRIVEYRPRGGAVRWTSAIPFLGSCP